MAFRAMNIPAIETERLILRSFEQRDTDAYAAIRADADVGNYIGGPLNRGHAWRFMAACIGHWQMRGFGFWCVEEKVSGTCIGHCGPWRPETWPENEIGYALGGTAQGKGYATEAASVSLRYAYEQLGWTTAISVIDPQNAGSQGVAKRLGATCEQRDVPIWDFTADIWRHLPPEQFLQSNPSQSLH